MVGQRILAFASMAAIGCAAQPASIIGHEGATSSVDENRIANLERAAKYPWLDEGACAVREAAGEWRALVERCYPALDRSRIQFRDLGHRCAVADVDAETAEQIVAICLMVQPEVAVGAAIVVGAVVIAAAIAAERGKQACDCICMGIDDVGKRHGPYAIGPRTSASKCNADCLAGDYKGGGVCR